ncbi:MAG TPA: hypothetical protein V6D28_13730 [Leptolyngbyaceae cyanobacterium]
MSSAWLGLPIPWKSKQFGKVLAKLKRYRRTPTSFICYLSRILIAIPKQMFDTVICWCKQPAIPKYLPN